MTERMTYQATISADSVTCAGLLDEVWRINLALRADQTNSQRHPPFWISLQSVVVLFYNLSR
jgi:hypothetical protein